MIAKVEPLTSARALRGPFDYLIDSAVNGVGVGSVLLVPFGRRQVLGVVTGLASESELPETRLASPIETIAPGTTAELVSLGLWVADQYCSTVARGLALVLPPGIGTGRINGRAGPAMKTIVSATDASRRALAGDGRLGPKQRAILESLEGGDLDAHELTEQAGADGAAIRRLAHRGLVELRKERVRRRPSGPAVGVARLRVEHTAAQKAAITRAVGLLPAGSGSNGGPGADRAGEQLLLHGVTGAGKTEVYLSVAEAAIARGLSVIALVPEISLTPQNLTRFNARLGERVAVLHSGLSAGERYDEWCRLRSGEATVCVGPRSAVFAPVSDLGLIIVDEEHDSSYKQESDPRYDAREVAAHRAASAGALLLAGSATPRPESWHSMERIELPERADGSPLPPVDVLDMRGVPGSAGPLHEASREALAQVCGHGGKAMVLLNRRGWSPHMECRDCGRPWRCANCDVSLVLHRGLGSVLRCHHCGFSEPVPQHCPDCGSVSISRHGTGTERLAELVGEIVTPAPVFRLDADSAARTGHAPLLAEFERAGSGVLVGTQMLAKGHDFAGLELGVVIDADSTLRFPDFRSEERTFALVAQLAGRIGRGSGRGRVLVQTLAPDAEAIACAARHDTPGFLAGELDRRAALAYPPFSHLVRVEVGAESGSEAMRAAAGLAERLRDRLDQGVSLLGPAPRFRVRGRSRAHFVVKGRTRAAIVDHVREVGAEASADGSLRGLSLAVDVDPQQ